jgi:hypothetical protein
VQPEPSLTTNNPSRSAAKPAKPRATDDPLTKRAHGLTTLAFEQKPKPLLRGGFNAVLGIVRAALEAGYSDDDARAAITAGRFTWSKRGFDFALKRAKRSSATVSYDVPAEVYR